MANKIIGDWVIDYRDNTVLEYHGKGDIIDIPDCVTGFNWNFKLDLTGVKKVNVRDGLYDINKYKVINIKPDENGFCIVGNYLVDCSVDSTTLVVPAGVKMLSSHSIESKPYIKKVVLPSSLEVIGAQVFEGCKRLESVVFAEGTHLKSIGGGAFSNCPNLVEVNLPEQIDKIYGNIFWGSERMINNQGFLIAGPHLFASPSNLESITIPEGVIRIGDYAFSECKSTLQSVTLPDGLKVIGRGAFKDCDCLTSINIPDSVIEIGKHAFYGTHIPKIEEVNFGAGDVNGCIVDDDGCLIGHTVIGPEIIVSDGIKCIRYNAITNSINDNERLASGKYNYHVVLPDSVEYIYDEFEGCTVNLPHGYLKQSEALDANTTYKLLIAHWENQVTFDDMAYMYFYQSSKNLKAFAMNHIRQNVPEAMDLFMKLLKENDKTIYYSGVAEFIAQMHKKIEADKINEFYRMAVSRKAKKAREMVEKYVTDTEIIKKPVAKPAKPLSPIEQFCSENFNENKLDASLKSATLPKTMFKNAVKFKGSGEMVPAFVLKCAVVPYMDLMGKRPGPADYKTGFVEVRFLEKCDKIAENFNKTSFASFLDRIYKGYYKPQTLIPLFRFGKLAHVKYQISEMKKWENLPGYRETGRSALKVARGALMLSDSREAMLYAEKCNNLGYYAKIRGLDEDELRERNMSDFGFDEAGRITIDLGIKTVDVTMNHDLTLTVYDSVACKKTKSIPKRGVDPKVYEQAAARFDDIKKNIKEVIKARNKKLFAMFLDGTTQPCEKWKNSYLKNPVLHKVAELVVWSQGDDSFILTENGVIDCNGNEYAIKDADIRVAHPIELDKEVVEAWQKYFTRNGLKQPFAQIWESVHSKADVADYRYAGIGIPFIRFRNREKDGINFRFDYFAADGYVMSFDGCNPDVILLDQSFDIDNYSRFEIRSLGIREYTRKINHIVDYFDRVTIVDRIAADDTEIEQLLPRYTLAKITEFINIAIEKKANNCLALLMEYKNNNFNDYDPMDEFIL